VTRELHGIISKAKLTNTSIYTSTMFDRKKKIGEALKESYGKQKDDSFNFELIEKYFKKKDKTGAYQVVSDKTSKRTG
jgi:hypothetical protein